MGTIRLTTREAAKVLELPLYQTCVILKASKTPYTKCGAAFLWDAAAVADLCVRLGKAVQK